MDIKELTAACDQLAEARIARDALDAKIAAKRAKFEEKLVDDLAELNNARQAVLDCQEVVLTAMHDADLKSWKTPHVVISRKVSTKYRIVDTDALLADLRKKRLAREYIVEQPAKHVTSLFGKVALQGVEEQTTEFISLQKNSKK